MFGVEFKDTLGFRDLLVHRFEKPLNVRTQGISFDDQTAGTVGHTAGKADFAQLFAQSFFDESGEICIFFIDGIDSFFSRCVNNEYDLLLYFANWPKSRINAWNILLPARAVENLSYVCGVNRVGCDGYGHQQGGASAVYSPQGEKLLQLGSQEEFQIVELNLEYLRQFREKFPAWKDADEFKIS